MTGIVMAVLTILAVVALLVILIGFVRYLTLTLDNTGENLVSATGVATTIRQDCEKLVDGVLTLNQNLTAAASALVAVTNSARQAEAAAAGSSIPAPASSAVVKPPKAALSSRPSARWPATPEEHQAPTTTPPTRLREPAPMGTAKAGISTATSGTRAIGATRREFRVRGSTP